MKVAFKVCPECNGRYSDHGLLCCPTDGSALLSVAEERDSMLGRVLDGRYEIVEKIAGGGFSTVYRALQHPLGRAVAVKVLSSRLRSDERQLTRFAREARAISRLKSPYTVELHDFGQAHDGSPYLVMELLEGRTLHRVFRQDGPLSPTRAALFGAHVCDSLVEAHGLGILHRDLKPDNVMIQEIAGEELARVLDFGLARIQGADLTVTGTGIVAGTPAYMSPEQALGERAVPQSDLYSLGVILYEAVSGRQPWRCETGAQTMRRHVEGTVPDIAEAAPDLGASFQKLIRRLTAVQPAHRPASAREVRGRLRALAGLSPSVSEIQIEPSKVAPNPAPDPKTRPWMMAAAALAAVLLLVAGIRLMVKDPPAPTAPPTVAPVRSPAPVAPARSEIEVQRQRRPVVQIPAPSARTAMHETPSARRHVHLGARFVTLTVRGPDGAELTLDGEPLGVLPFSGSVRAGSTNRVLQARLAGRRTVRQSVVLDEDTNVGFVLPRRTTGGNIRDLIEVR